MRSSRFKLVLLQDSSLAVELHIILSFVSGVGVGQFVCEFEEEADGKDDSQGGCNGQVRDLALLILRVPCGAEILVVQADLVVLEEFSVVDDSSCQIAYRVLLNHQVVNSFVIVHHAEVLITQLYCVILGIKCAIILVWAFARVTEASGKLFRCTVRQDGKATALGDARC